VDAGVPVDTLLANAAVSQADEPVSELGASGTHRTVLAREGVRCAADVSGLDARTALYASTGASRLSASIDQARVALADRVHRARGVEFVTVPRAAIELDVDIEDDGGGVCYLIGVKETLRSRGSVESRFIPFVTWDHTEEAEARNFAAFWNHITETIATAARSRTGAVRIFVWSGHEERYFTHMAEQHAGVAGVPTVDEVESLCASEVWVDMYPILAKQLVWPTEDLTLKSLAKYARHMWRDETPGGANSVAWYQGQSDANQRGDIDTRDELRQRLLDYNEDDVIATYALREFIAKMGEARRPGQKLPGVESLDRTWGPGRPRTPRRR
jgi:predicted RecB family nuclease